jgi:hypothetical protein
MEEDPIGRRDEGALVQRPCPGQKIEKEIDAVHLHNEVDPEHATAGAAS